MRLGKQSEQTLQYACTSSAFKAASLDALWGLPRSPLLPGKT
jgi:hypothetical protein